MTYHITGIDPSIFRHLYGQPEEVLSAADVQRMAVTAHPGFPCRIGLEDVAPGRTVLLLNHESVPEGPYRASHAIFVEEGAKEPATYRDTIPPALDRRVLSLRAFDVEHLMVDAALVQPGEADEAIRRLLANEEVHYIHAHNAVRGCFAAAVERA